MIRHSSITNIQTEKNCNRESTSEWSENYVGGGGGGGGLPGWGGGGGWDSYELRINYKYILGPHRFSISLMKYHSTCFVEEEKT